MVDLIKTDIYKMIKSSFIKILFGISCLSAGLMLLFAHLIALGDMDIQNIGITSLFADSQIFTLLGCVIIGIFLCNDFEYKIIENAISSGHSRNSIVISKVVSLTILVAILTLPYLAVILFAVGFNIEVTVYLSTAYLTIMGFAASGTSFTNIFILIVLAIMTYSAQLSIGIFIMFLVKKPVISIALSYVCLLLLGPVLSLNDLTKNIMEYTPFGVNYSQIISDFEIVKFIYPVSICIIFIAFFTYLSMLSFKKCEVK